MHIVYNKTIFIQRQNNKKIKPSQRDGFTYVFSIDYFSFFSMTIRWTLMPLAS